ARVDTPTDAPLASPVNAIPTVTGTANEIPSGEKTNTGESAVYASGAGEEETLIEKSTFPSIAPAGTVSLTPSPSTVPPPAPKERSTVGDDKLWHATAAIA